MMGCFCGCVKRRTRVWVEEVISLSLSFDLLTVVYLLQSLLVLTTTTTTSVPAIYLLYLPHCTKAPKPSLTGTSPPTQQHAICDVSEKQRVGRDLSYRYSEAFCDDYRIHDIYEEYRMEERSHMCLVVEFCHGILLWRNYYS